MYIMFRNVVCISRTDSEIFDDSVELQQFFIKIRDELCKNGEILMSSALNFTLKHLHSDVEQEKREKIPKEIEEDRQKAEEEETKGWCKCEVYSLNASVINVSVLVFFKCKQADKPQSQPQEPCREESEEDRVYIQDCSYDNNTYRVGDFVYVEPSESKLQPHIVLIERMWEDKAGNPLIMLL